MKPKLLKMKCWPCEGIGDKLSKKQIENNIKHLKGWKLVNNYRLAKTYKFKDFKSTLNFVNKLGKIAEQQGHHPNINFTWGKAEVMFYTHVLNGLSMNDFIMATKTNDIYKNQRL